jgi:NAD+ kinase
MKTAAIISRPGRPEVAQILSGLLDWLTAHGYKVVADAETAEYVTGLEVISRSEMGAQPLDLMIVLGGDGTLLSAARITAAIDVPILGVNLGTLGFLTEVSPQSLYPMLDRIAHGRASVETRVLMQCDLLRGSEVRGSYLVFNDAVVNKTTLARLNTYDLYIDKVFVSSYRAGPDADGRCPGGDTSCAALSHPPAVGRTRFRGD